MGLQYYKYLYLKGSSLMHYVFKDENGGFMHYTVYHLVYFFFLYSFLGWVIEEIYAAFAYGRFVNRGFINGPLCPKYGICMLIIITDVHDLAAHPVYQFFVCIATAMVLEYVSGVLLLRLTGRRFWDYSGQKWNLGGHICFKSVAVWGILSVLWIWLVHPFAYIAYEMVPRNIMKIMLILLLAVFAIDLFVMIAASLKWKLQGSLYGNVAQRLGNTKDHIGQKVFCWIQKRVYRAFPEFEQQEQEGRKGFGNPQNRVFAKGLCLDKLIWIFLLSALLGDWIETIFVWVTAGRLMSRSSLLYGTFSVVWGLGGALATALLYPLRDKNDRFVFIGGFLLGGVYEYSCSVFTEIVFGTVFWDYSHLPFNINGRINLLFCFFWGIAAIFWVKLLYPNASRLIEKIPPVMGKVLTWFGVLAMVLDMAISGMAIGRYTARLEGQQPKNAVEEFLDWAYEDDFIERIYPNMKVTSVQPEEETQVLP